MTTQEILDTVDQQLASKGVATVSVKDGRILFLTVAVLENLLATAREEGADRAVLFIQTGTGS